MERAEDLPTFGPYQAIDVLGSGGMGVVWRARHRDTGELVALKTSQPRTEALRAIDAEIRVRVGQHLDKGQLVADLVHWRAHGVLRREDGP